MQQFMLKSRLEHTTVTQPDLICVDIRNCIANPGQHIPVQAAS